MAKIHNTARQRLARASATPHPDADLLTAFAEGGLRGAERDQVLAHLSACGDCREVVMLAQPEEAEAALAEVAPTRTWSSWYRLRWGAVAATLVIIAGAVLIYNQQNATFEAKMARPPQTISEEKVATKEQPQAPAQQKQTLPTGSVGGRIAKAETHAASPEPAKKKDELTLAKQKPAPLAQPTVTNGVVGGLVATNKPNTATGPGYIGGTGGGALNLPPASTTTANVTPPPPPATNQTVEVAAEGNAVQTATQTTDMAAAKTAKRAERKDRDQVTATTTNEYSGVATTPPTTTDMKMARMRPAAPHWQWRVNNAGVVERSTDTKHWQAMPPSSAHFVAVVSSGSEVWAGGTGGALYRSIDDGAHWTKVALSSTADVKGLTLTAPNHVLVTTSEGTQPVSEPQP